MGNNPMSRTPDNAFTRLQNELSGLNVSGGRVGVASATPMPTVRSAGMGTELPPLSVEEQAELDAKARALGLLPPDPGADSAYPTQEAAVEAGQTLPVMTAREFLAQQPVRSPRMVVGAPSRLPNFRNVQAIDLVKGVVVLDGMEFPMPAADVTRYRKYAVKIAHGQITSLLKEARKAPRRSRRRKNGEAGTTSTAAPVQREPARDRQEPQG